MALAQNITVAHSCRLLVRKTALDSQIKDCLADDGWESADPSSLRTRDIHVIENKCGRNVAIIETDTLWLALPQKLASSNISFTPGLSPVIGAWKNETEKPLKRLPNQSLGFHHRAEAR